MRAKSSDKCYLLEYKVSCHISKVDLQTSDTNYWDT